jgi:hypothetical protein
MAYGKGNIILRQSTLINHGTGESPPKGLFRPRAMTWAIGVLCQQYISPDCADPKLMARLRKQNADDGW